MFPFGFLAAAIPGLFACIQVTHPLEEGVDRYVDMLTGPEPKYPAGSMMFSDVQCGCLMWGANSKHMVDNRKFAPYLDDPALNEKTYAEVQRVTQNWHSNVGVPKPQTMQV